MTMMDIERKIPKLAVSLTKLLANIFSKKKKKKKKKKKTLLANI